MKIRFNFLATLWANVRVFRYWQLSADGIAIVADINAYVWTRCVFGKSYCCQYSYCGNDLFGFVISYFLYSSRRTLNI